ncbi:MAG: DUF1109 family protein [Deltaproteobacteria bacterium]|nr:DUF1109 family protein [Deltaproteobacteria bacterium]
METSATHHVRYDELINRLIEKFEPARRIWPIWARLALWLILEFSILSLVAFGAPRPNLLAALGNPAYVMQVVLFVVVGVAAAALALRTAIPGLEATTMQLSPVFLAAAVSILVAALAPAQTEISLGAFIGVGMKCLVCTGLLAALPWLALFWAVRRGAPLASHLAGVLVGVAAFSFACAATRLGCPIDDSLHVLTWHLFPAAAGTALSMLAGVAWLGRKTLSQTGSRTTGNYR